MKKALTIGELLITMAIIGTIATLVLPGFLKDYHKKLYTARLKKTVEMLENAVNQACIDNNVSYFYQTPYGQYASGGVNQQEFIDKYFKKTNAAGNPFKSTYKNLNGSSAGNPSSLANSGWAKLEDGSAIHFFCQWSSRCVFRIDVNSTDGPNVMGRDFFTVPLDIYTNELGGIYNQNGEQHDPSQCGNQPYAYGCYERLLQDNWEMKY